ncbi:MAG: glycoside hydrolase family 2 protein [Treponema sp.]|nr:glycoside hydrolase family 2 protein [Treponema sp.]
MNKINLQGNWSLSGVNPEGEKILCPVSIPGDFHTALLKEGIIADPYKGFNEQEQLWVGKSDWKIERKFNFTPCEQIENSEKSRTFITLTEADTFFTLYINGKEAGRGKNQFARHRFDISDFLVKGENTVSILFESAENKAGQEAEKLPYSVPCMSYDVCSPNRNLARKCQCHGGWDWGPCIMVSGIYGEIFLETVNSGLFNYVNVFYEHKNNDWTAKVHVNYYSFVNKIRHFDFKIEGSDITESSVSKEIALKDGENLFTVEIPVKNPSVWKTSGELEEAGLSENVIYTLSSCVLNEDLSIDSSEYRKISFNTLKAVTYKDTVDEKDGRCLYFENNGRRIFAKGSNWIPAENLPSRLTDERYEDLLKSAILAHHNCIRVWGGGFYEKEKFYDLCDLYGLIVWQDFMFACSMYPASDDFLLNVQYELDYQIPRLQTHACIGIWCGNNENYGAMNWFRESVRNHDRYMVDYDRLYHGTIGKTVKKYDTRLYWPSSPCAGPDDFADNWHADTMGDMHYWSVWHERKSFDAYLGIRPRFVSEFGYESFPSMECIRSFANENDLNFTGKLMEYHQRSPSGNSIIIENFSRYFKFPNGFENMVYLSQVQQAVAIKTAVDWWRSLAPNCMGALIWQLNDIWPGASWSSLEYNGKWKLLHYVSCRFFASIYIPSFIKDDDLYAKVCNETASSVDVNVKISYLHFDGTEAFPCENKSVRAEPDAVTDVFVSKINKKEADSFFIYVSSEFEGNVYNEVVFPSLYKHSDIKKANIKMKINQKKSVYEVELSADNPAFFVSLDNDELPGIFSDNMITLLPGKKETITFVPQKGTKPSLEEVVRKISVKDLSSSW